ncbi:hypothetical protein [Nocardia heshunensis]
MAVLGILDVQGITTDQYNAVVERMGVEAKGRGSIYLHLAAETEGGLQIIEVWDDKDEYVQFIEQTLVPTMDALGIEQTHSIAAFPLHNVFTPRLEELPGLSRLVQAS